jgi:hypothetical protein
MTAKNDNATRREVRHGRIGRIGGRQIAEANALAIQAFDCFGDETPGTAPYGELIVPLAPRKPAVRQRMSTQPRGSPAFTTAMSPMTLA